MLSSSWTGAFRLLMVIALSFALGACGWFLNGKKKEAEVLEMSDEGFSCLGEIPTAVEESLDARAGEQKLREAFACLRTALADFGRRTQGQTSDIYAVSDLENFFQKYLLKDRRLPANLVAGLMRLKGAMLGGTSSHLTKVELSRLMMVLEKVENEVVALEFHLPVLLMRRTFGQVSEAAIDGAVTQLRASIRILLREVDLSRSDYGFNEFREVALGVMELVRGTDPAGFRARLDHWWPLVEGVKEIFFGETARFQGERDWLAAVDSLADLASVGLKFRYLVPEEQVGERVQKTDLLSPETSTLLFRMADQLLLQLERAPVLRISDRIEFTAIDKVLRQAGRLELLPSGLGGPEALMDLLERVMVRMMDPARAPTDAIKRVHLMSLRREFDLLRTMHESLAGVFSGRSEIPWTEMSEGVASFDAVRVLTARRRSSIDLDIQKSGWIHFLRLVDRDRPIVYLPSGRVQVSADPRSVQAHWLGMVRFLFSHALVRGFMFGYGDHADPTRARCGEAGMVQWYADFKNFGIAIKAFDPRSENSGARSFKEASFFTYAGNGDEALVFDEMFEFTSLLFAGGLGNVGAVREALDSADSGCVLDGVDVFGFPLLNEACVSRRIRGGFARFFDNLPGMATAVAAMTDRQWDEFMSDWMQASRSSAPDGGVIETADLRTGVMILHYTESLFTMYDTNRDGFLDVQEIRSGSPRFMSFIRDLSPVKTDWFVREAFVALVLNGQKPDAWAMAGHGGREFLDLIGLGEVRRADRGHVIRVFRTLSQELSAPRPE